MFSGDGDSLIAELEYFLGGGRNVRLRVVRKENTVGKNRDDTGKFEAFSD